MSTNESIATLVSSIADLTRGMEMMRQQMTEGFAKGREEARIFQADISERLTATRVELTQRAIQTETALKILTIRMSNVESINSGTPEQENSFQESPRSRAASEEHASKSEQTQGFSKIALPKMEVDAAGRQLLHQATILTQQFQSTTQAASLGAPLLITTEVTKCSASLNGISLETVYKWNKAILEFEHKNSIVVLLAPLLTSHLQRVLSSDGLATGALVTTNSAIREAIRKQLNRQRYSALHACEVAKRCIHIPKQAVWQGTDRERRTMDQLHNLTSYFRELMDYEAWCVDFVGIEFPFERNKFEKECHRMHDLVADQMKADAELAWAVLKQEFDKNRKLGFKAFLVTISLSAASCIDTLANSSALTRLISCAPERIVAPTGGSKHFHKVHNIVTEQQLLLEEHASESEETGELWKDVEGEEDADTNTVFVNAITDRMDGKLTSQELKDRPCNAEMFSPPCKHGDACLYSHSRDMIRKKLQEALQRASR